MRRKSVLRKLYFVSLGLLPILICSCNKNIVVRDDLKEFTSKFSFANCYKKYRGATLKYTSSIVVDDVITATKKIELTFSILNQGNYSYDYLMENTGDFITSDYPAYKHVIVTPKEEENSYQRSSTIDDKETVETIDENAVIWATNDFYYTQEIEDGTYTGGMYYGDDIKRSFEYQHRMSIVLEGDEKYLLFDSGYVVDDDNNIMLTTYKVNSDGMVLNSHSEGLSGEKRNKKYNSELVVEYKDIVKD